MISSLIDTVRVHAAIDHQLWIAAQSALFHAGTINPITKACAGHYRRFKVAGAFGAVATVWSIKSGTELVIECSIARFFTGQNVFGSEDLRAAVFKLIREVCRFLGIRPTDAEKKAVREGHSRLARVDLTLHKKFESDVQVRYFLKATKLYLAFASPYFSTYKDDALYICQHSDNKSMKWYSKGSHIQAFPLDRGLPHRDYIEAASEGLLRVELVLRRRFLAHSGMAEVRNWDPQRARKILIDDVEALSLRNLGLIEYKHQSSLSNQANALLAAHMAGVDVETVVPSARALAAHAGGILATTGINVYVPFVAQTAGLKCDLESFAESLQFGTDPDAIALGITRALPLSMTEKAKVRVGSVPSAAPPASVALPKGPGPRPLKMRRIAGSRRPSRA